MEYSDLLRELARRYGVALSYEEIGGEVRHAREEDLQAILGAMGVDVRDAGACRRSLHESEREQTRLLEPVIVCSYARGFPLRVEARVPLHESAEDWVYELFLEGGLTISERIVDEDFLRSQDVLEFEGLTYVRRHFVIEHAPPPGYHRLRIYQKHSLQENRDTTECVLISYPDECHVSESSAGVSLQLYALRSKRNCGSGEFADLQDLGPWLERRNYGAVAVSPVHAGYPSNPLHASPYSPSNRRFVSPAYIAPRRVAEWEGLAPDARAAENGESVRSTGPGNVEHPFDGDEVGRPGPHIDYVAAGRRRLALLEKLFAIFQELHLKRNTARARKFQEFCDRHGDALRHQALYDSLYECFFQEHEPAMYGWRQWPSAVRHPDGPAVEVFARARPDRVVFYQYLYWLAEEQRESLRESLLQRNIQLNLDLAVGADAGGAETWIDREVYALHASAGAPPDPFAPRGQNWGLAPMIPHRLRRRAYRPFIEMLQANLPEDGILRIDHIVQLFRLYWAAPDECGAYVYYPFEDLLGILCLESRRRRCTIVGEDLGTVPANVREELAARNILSWRVVYFEKNREGFAAPEDFTERSIATLNTHDLPTLRGYWNAADVRLLDNLGTFSSLEAGRAREERERDKRALLQALVERNLISAADLERHAKAYSPELRDALHRFLDRAGSRLRLYSLHDLLDEAAQPNLPGTVHEYPNWALSYSVTVEELLDTI